MYKKYSNQLGEARRFLLLLLSFLLLAESTPIHSSFAKLQSSEEFQVEEVNGYGLDDLTLKEYIEDQVVPEDENIDEDEDLVDETEVPQEEQEKLEENQKEREESEDVPEKLEEEQKEREESEDVPEKLEEEQREREESEDVQEEEEISTEATDDVFENGIKGVVWLDEDGTGESKGDQPVLSGIVVKLYHAEDQTLIETTQTKAQGEFEFKGLSDRYIVRIDSKGNEGTFNTYNLSKELLIERPVVEEVDGDLINFSKQVGMRELNIGLTPFGLHGNINLSAADRTLTSQGAASDGMWSFSTTGSNANAIVLSGDGIDITLTGTAPANRRILVTGNDATIRLNGITITDPGFQESAITLESAGNHTIIVEAGTTNTLVGGATNDIFDTDNVLRSAGAGIRTTDSILTITGSGTLHATGGLSRHHGSGSGAGIGGASNIRGPEGAGGTGGNLTIMGNVTIVATGGSSRSAVGAGIGGAGSMINESSSKNAGTNFGGSGGIITITDNATVTATGGAGSSSGGAGIGGGSLTNTMGPEGSTGDFRAAGSGGTISIRGNATVTATGIGGSAGIGGGGGISSGRASAGASGTIRILENATVTATHSRYDESSQGLLLGFGIGSVASSGNTDSGSITITGGRVQASHIRTAINVFTGGSINATTVTPAPTNGPTNGNEVLGLLSIRDLSPHTPFSELPVDSVPNAPAWFNVADTKTTAQGELFLWFPTPSITAPAAGNVGTVLPTEGARTVANLSVQGHPMLVLSGEDATDGTRPTWLAVNGNELIVHFKPEQETAVLPGVYHIRAVATNLFGIDHRDFSVVVRDMNMPQDGVTMVSYEHTMNLLPVQEASEPELTGVRWSASGLPPGLTMDVNGRITGTPTDAGTFDVNFTVTHSEILGTKAQRTLTRSITILASEAPKIDSPKENQIIPVMYDHPIAPISIVTTDDPNFTTYLTLTGALPDGLTFNPSTGEITGTPNSTAQIGTDFIVTIRAANDIRYVDRTFTIRAREFFALEIPTQMVAWVTDPTMNTVESQTYNMINHSHNTDVQLHAGVSADVSTPFVLTSNPDDIVFGSGGGELELYVYSDDGQQLQLLNSTMAGGINQTLTSTAPSNAVTWRFGGEYHGNVSSATVRKAVGQLRLHFTPLQ